MPAWVSDIPQTQIEGTVRYADVIELDRHLLVYINRVHCVECIKIGRKLPLLGAWTHSKSNVERNLAKIIIRFHLTCNPKKQIVSL